MTLSHPVYVKCGTFEESGRVAEMSDAVISVGPRMFGCPYAQRNLNLVIRNVSDEAVTIQIPRSVIKPIVLLTYANKANPSVPIVITRNVVMHDNVYDGLDDGLSGDSLLFRGTLAPNATVTLPFHYTISREDTPSILPILRMQNVIDIPLLRAYNPESVLEKISILDSHFLGYAGTRYVESDTLLWTAGFVCTAFAAFALATTVMV